MLGGVAVVCVLLAASRVVGALAMAGLVLALLCVAAHVAGNALGAQLRANGSQPLRDPAADHGLGGSGERIVRPPSPTEADFAPVTALSYHTALGRVMFVAIGAGGVLGGVLGGGVLAVANWERATIANTALGAISCAVLGGLWGFWASSFFKVIWRAWSEAKRRDR
jgi:hypothetical protein